MPYTRADIGKTVAPHVPQPFHVETTIHHTVFTKCWLCSKKTSAELELMHSVSEEDGDKGCGWLLCPLCKGYGTVPAGQCPKCEGRSWIECPKGEGEGETEQVFYV